MDPDANPPARTDEQRRADDDRYVAISDALADAVEDVVPEWIEGLVVDLVEAWSGYVSAPAAAAAVAAGEAARDEVMPALRDLLATDIDGQRANPLALLRDATRHAHAVLADLEVPAMPRDQFARNSFPDDVYGLVPASWDEIDPSLQEVGLTWGAAKAFLFKARRREEGQA